MGTRRGEGARPRAPGTGLSLWTQDNAGSGLFVGFGNHGSRGRDPSRFWVRRLPMSVNLRKLCDRPLTRGGRASPRAGNRSIIVDTG